MAPRTRVPRRSPPSNQARLWPHCSQLLALSRAKLLVVTDVEGSVWRSTMDAVLKDSAETLFRLMYKASGNGGRAIAGG